MTFKECDKHEMIGCTYCSGKETAIPAEKEDPDWLNPIRTIDWRPSADPNERIAMMVASGAICGRCMTETTGRGCYCNRRAAYDDQIPAANDWLKQQVEESTLTGKEASGMAFGAQARSARLASLTEDDKAADRLDIMVDFEVKPEWSVVRTVQASIFPI
jgi:hypothetical protein